MVIVSQQIDRLFTCLALVECSLIMELWNFSIPLSLSLSINFIIQMYNQRSIFQKNKFYTSVSLFISTGQRKRIKRSAINYDEITRKRQLCQREKSNLIIIDITLDYLIEKRAHGNYELVAEGSVPSLHVSSINNYRACINIRLQPR